MKWTHEFEPTGQPITDAHQGRFAEVASLYHHQDPTKLATFEERARHLDGLFPPGHREALVQSLRPFLQQLEAPQAARDALEKLGQKDSLVVVAGQQAGLFTGPLYAIYKALSAVGLARRLETELGRPVVPVFWIASEDHDFAEVDHAYVLDPTDEVHRVRLPEAAPLHQMVHYYQVPEASAHAVIREAAHLLPEGPYRDEALGALEDTFRPGNTLAEWFGRLMYRMLGNTGIVLLDPCLPGLRRLVSGVWTKVLHERHAVSERLTEKYAAVEQMEFHPAVIRDEMNTTLFYVDEAEGKRYVMERDTEDDSVLHVRGLGVTRSVDAWLDLAEQHPTSFSSNVLLRPVVQDHLLPTLAFVGGPAEIAYHALSAGVFESTGRQLPPLLLRDRLTLYPPSVIRNMEKWGIDRAVVRHPTDLQARAVTQLGASQIDEAIQQFSAQTEQRWEAFVETWEHLGPQVEHLVQAQIRRELTGVRKSMHKVRHLFATRHDTELRQLRHVERWLWTDGHPQERRLCPLNVWATMGLSWLPSLPIWGDYTQTGGSWHVEL